MKIQDMLQALKSGKKLRQVDVVLIELNTFYEINLAAFNMGLLYIGTLLKQNGFKVKCLGVGDMFFSSLQQQEEFFTTAQPVLVGFYTISDNIRQVRDMAVRIKSWLPQAVIVVGGPLATVEGSRLLEDSPYDIVGLGEGEHIMLKLAEYFVNGSGSLEDIEGIIYRKPAADFEPLTANGGDRSLMRNPGFGWVEDLDILPFPDFDLIGVNKVFFVVSGRGCPFNCAFCFQGVHGKQYRYRSADKVVQEVIANLEKYRVQAFGFIDDTFVANIKRVREIIEPLSAYRVKHHKDFIFFCEARVDILAKHPELLPFLKSAGLARVQVGIESGNQEMLKLFNKKIDLSQIESAVTQLGELKDVSMHSNFILGAPETPGDFGRTLELAKKLLRLAPGWFECAIGFLCPYPGTKVAMNLEDFGVELLDPGFDTGITVRDCFHNGKYSDYFSLWRTFTAFSRAISEEMRALAPGLPFATVARHYDWAQMGMVTTWYQVLFNTSGLLKDYFAFRQSPRFKRLDDIPLRDLKHWRPMRVLKSREYDSNNYAVINAGYAPLVISDAADNFIYDHAAGKLTLGEIARLLAEKLKTEEQSLWERKIIPFLRTMEAHYLMVFYQ